MVKDIIKQFDEHFKVFDAFDKAEIYDYKTGKTTLNGYVSNVRHAAHTWSCIVNLWAKYRDELYQWRNTYFTEHRTEIYNKYFMDRGWKLMNDNLNPYWRFTEADDDFIANCPDQVQWQAAEQIVRAARDRMDMRNCDPDILRQHDGEEHMEGLICLLCDSIEWTWRKKVEAEVRSQDNIFLNVNSRNTFSGRVSSSWVGPSKVPCVAEPLPSTNGKTPCKAMQSLLANMSSIRYTFHSIYTNTDYDIFLNLWNKLDFVNEHIGTYESHIAAIVTDL
jgi:hypothetical protein